MHDNADYVNLRDAQRCAVSQTDKATKAPKRWRDKVLMPDKDRYVNEGNATTQYVRCPHCQTVDTASELLDDWNGTTYRCMRCGERFHLGEADNWLSAPSTAY